MVEQGIPLSVGLLLFLIGGVCGRKILSIFIPLKVRRRKLAEHVYNSLPEIRHEIERVKRVDWSKTKYVSVVTDLGAVVGFIHCGEGEDGVHVTEVFLKPDGSYWERI